MTAEKQEETKKQPKETDKIKALLKAYPKLQQRIDLAEERLAFLEYTMGSPSSPSLTGMPSGSRDRTSKQERDFLKKCELEEKLGELYAEESRLREEIEGMIERMERPEEQTVIEMRYFDEASWRAISAAVYGNEPDYDANENRYLKRTFKLHGSALQTLLKIYKQDHGEK